MPSEKQEVAEWASKRAKKWHEFEVISPELALLRAHSSTHSMRFKLGSRGQQGSAVCCVAAVLGHLLQTADWRAGLLECALDYGDRLYRASKAKHPPGNHRMLTCCQLDPEFYVGGYKCRLCVEPALLQGSGPCDLERALGELLLRPEAAFGVVANSRARFAAVWSRPDEGPELFHFEPGPCDERGLRTRGVGAAGAAACLARCAGLCELHARLAHDLGCAPGEADFCVDRLSLVRVKPVGRGKWRSRDADKLVLEPRVLQAFAGAPRGGRAEAKLGSEDGLLRKLEAAATPAEAGAPGTCYGPLIERQLDSGRHPGYPELWTNVPPSLGPVPYEPAAAILHGYSHEASEAYKAKGLQTLANCAMALGMRRVHPVRTWLRKSLDQVLATGDELHARVKDENPGIQSMTGADLHNAKFQIDARKMIVDVDLLTVVGTIVSKIPTVVNLKQGLQEFFLNDSQGVLECSSLAVSLWHEDDYYYLFDPRACDVNGLHSVNAMSGGKGSDDALSTEKKPIGKSCVIRFTNLALLETHLLKNINPTDMSDRFIIRRITIVDDIPGTRQWNSFEPAIVRKSWMLKGTISGDNEIFNDHSRGVQGLAIAAVGLISANNISPSNWFKEDVDDVVRGGDSYYNWCIPSGGESDTDEEKSLGVQNLKKYLYFKKCKAVIDVIESCVMGNLEAENDSDTKSLESGVFSFFEEHKFGIVESNKRFFAIWKYEEELKDKSKETAYYLIHDNPSQAFVNKILSKPDKIDLSACVLRFVEAAELAAILSELLQLQSEEDQLNYFIHEVKIVSVSEPMTDEEIEKDKATPVRPDLRNYTAFNEYGAALAGSFNQNNEILFKRETRNRQQAASALVALAMTKIFYPYLWYREIVDDILKMGDKLTYENLKNLPEADDEDGENARHYLLPSEIESDFALGVNQISVGVEEETFTGKLDELQSNLQEFFTTNRMGIFRQDKIILPFWREENVFFMMDPVGNQAGNACVYWFITIESFVEILIEFVEKSDGSFFIDTITIDNKFIESELPEENLITEEHWYNFSKVAEGIWQIDCKANDETDAEDNADIEAKYNTAISIMAIVFSKAYEPRFWSKELLNEIIVSGKTLQAQSAVRLGEDRLLRPNEVIDEFFVSNRRIELDVQDCVQAGKVNSQHSNIQSLQSGCVKFFEKFSSGCLSLLAFTTQAIWTIDDYFYSFEPGSPLMRFANLTLLTNQLETIADESSDFEITSIDVVDWNKLPPWHFDPSPAVRPSDLPPLNAYSRLPGKARAILRGFSHQESKIFPDDVRSRQTAANCIISLAMSLIKNPITWTRKTLDEILALGLNLHLESVKNSSATSLMLKLQDIVRIFQMGSNVMAVDVENDTVTGIVDQPPPQPDEGGKGKKQKGSPEKGNKDKKKRGKATKRARPEPPAALLLAEGLDRFFENNSAGVLVTGRFMVAIWRANGVYFMYDPRPRDAQGQRSEDNDGAATSCVCWFACKQPLFRLIAGNVNEDERYGCFQICKVLARRLAVESLPAPPAPGPGIATCHFERLDEQLSVLPAGPDWHLAATRFPPENRGLQSSAVACTALVLVALHAPPSWTPELLRAALRHGDQLHSACTRLRRQGARNLAPAELPRLFALAEMRAQVSLQEGLAAGISLEGDLLRALEAFFREEGRGRDAAILYTSGLALALARHSRKFYLLDPGDRNARSCACLLRCDGLPALARAVLGVGAFRRPALYTLNALRVVELYFFDL